jgi:DNA end-binding protein Ku
MEVLRYADEVHKAQGYFRDIEDAKPDADLLDLATTLIDKKTAPFHPAEFHDRYVDALHRLIDKKAKSKSNKRILEDVEAPASGKSNVIDLMAALKKSVGEGGAKTTPRKPPASKAADKEPAKKPATRTRKSA